MRLVLWQNAVWEKIGQYSLLLDYFFFIGRVHMCAVYFERHISDSVVISSHKETKGLCECP